MRYLDRLINFIFSLVILVLAIIVIMVSAGFIGYDNVDSWIRLNIFSTTNNTTTCIVAIITLIAALKTTVFLSRMNPKKKNTILVDTNHGKIQIAAETIENTAKTVVKDYVEIKDAQVKMVKEKKGIKVYMALLVLPNTNIIELSAKVQDEVKEAIEDTTGVKVNNVDIKIKNITENRKAKAQIKEAEESKETVDENIKNDDGVVATEDVVIPEENVEETKEQNENE